MIAKGRLVGFRRIVSMYLKSNNIILLAIFFMLSNHLAYAAPLSNDVASKIIEINRGLWASVPIGKVGIKTAIASQFEDGKVYLGKKGDLHQYTAEYKNILNALEKCGVIQISDEYFDNARTAARNMEIMKDGHKYIISLTAEGTRLNTFNPKFGFARFDLGLCKIKKLVKNVEIRNSQKYGTKDMRLVMGIYEIDYTELGTKYYSLYKAGFEMQKQSKFRALLEFDPFKERYKVYALDVGDPVTDKWHSTHVDE